MSTPQDPVERPRAQGVEGPTRDIRLPPLPGHPPPVLPPEWRVRPPSPSDVPPTPSGEPPRPDPLAEQPTDTLPAPWPQHRERTLAFDDLSSPSGAAAGHNPAPDGRRRWPWVVLTLLPILVIVVSGLLLLFLLGGA